MDDLRYRNLETRLSAVERDEVAAASRLYTHSIRLIYGAGAIVVGLTIWLGYILTNNSDIQTNSIETLVNLAEKRVDDATNEIKKLTEGASIPGYEIKLIDGEEVLKLYYDGYNQDENKNSVTMLFSGYFNVWGIIEDFALLQQVNFTRKDYNTPKFDDNNTHYEKNKFQLAKQLNGTYDKYFNKHIAVSVGLTQNWTVENCDEYKKLVDWIESKESDFIFHVRAIIKNGPTNSAGSELPVTYAKGFGLPECPLAK